MKYAIIIVLTLPLISVARGEDYWTTCEGAYQFCTHRPYHRDCSIWTVWGRPLQVTGYHWEKLDLPPVCRDFPWHISCVVNWRQVRDDRECPIPTSGDNK